MARFPAKPSLQQGRVGHHRYGVPDAARTLAYFERAVGQMQRFSNHCPHRVPMPIAAVRDQALAAAKQMRDCSDMRLSQV